MRKWLVVLAALAAGCSDPTSERDFRLSIREEEGPLEPGASVEVFVNAVRVTGAFVIPCDGGKVSGALERPAARELVLVLNALWPAECNDTPHYFAYVSVIDALASGTWNLKVVHATNRSGVPPDTVLSQAVAVP